MTDEQQQHSDRERIRARKNRRRTGKDPAPTATDAAGSAKSGGILREIRGWADALFFAFLLAMFIRTYVFELFMIPTGSMTPTLIGDDARIVSEYDWDGDGIEDIITIPSPRAVPHVQVHLRNPDGSFGTQLFLDNPGMDVRRQFATEVQKGKGRRDMIMVNKFIYWFSPPERADIVVFKVPDRPSNNPLKDFPFNPQKPVYIKRCVGLPGETVTFQPVDSYTDHLPDDPDRLTPSHFGGIERILNTRPLLINGEPLTEDPFDRLHHFPPPSRSRTLSLPRTDEDYLAVPLDDQSVLMAGDNQMSSLDSRYWGGVPLSHLRGKAILRYLPLRSFGFLSKED